MWEINFEPKAKKHLARIDKKAQQRILNYLHTIRFQDPKLFGKPLTANKKGLWRYRVGDYRILCHIKQNQLLILVIHVGHRKDVYL